MQSKMVASQRAVLLLSLAMAGALTDAFQPPMLPSTTAGLSGLRRLSPLASTSTIQTRLRPARSVEAGALSMQMQPNNKLELSGMIKVINDMMTFDSGFTKREFVVTTSEMYPQDIKFEVIKERCMLLDSFSPGEQVKVSFNIRGNQYQGKYYVNLQAWRIEKMGEGGLAAQVEASMGDVGGLSDGWDGFGASAPPAKQAAPPKGAGSKGKAANIGWDEDVPF
mmetsp:Transcript_60278/g.142009  ORF Transcript_60278/g.142009 Transcript_60278/m.142009 type:complete len:223 (-) Transcript_60278:36-704(-)